MCLEVIDSNALDKFNTSCNNGVWLVWYYADWCGHCKTMEPEWDSLKENNVHSVNLAKVNDDFVSQVKNDAPVQGYPTIILYKNGKVVGVHNGERTAENFNDYINSNITSAELASNKKTEKTIMSGMNSGINTNTNTNNSTTKPKAKKPRKKSKKRKRSSNNSKSKPKPKKQRTKSKRRPKKTKK